MAFHECSGCGNDVVSQLEWYGACPPARLFHTLHRLFAAESGGILALGISVWF